MDTLKNMNLTNIAMACGGKLMVASARRGEAVTGVVIDSRLLMPGNLFIATKGEKVDGHSFIPQAAAKGAVAVVCEQPPESDIPYLLVKDSFQALKDIAAFYRRQLTLPVIGITGSVGKTSTKEFIAGVLRQKYQVLKTEGNFNNEIGLPLTVLRIRDHHEAAVLEMGISDFGEMHRLADIARPDICVLTNIGQSHLESLGSREGILKAKAEIFDFLNEKGHVCLNGDDEMLATLREVKGQIPLRFGLDPAHDIYAEQIENKGLFGSRAIIHVKRDFSGGADRINGVTAAAFPKVTDHGVHTAEPFPVEIPLPGVHMIYNALAAVAVGCLLGLDQREIQKGIAGLTALKGRSNLLRLPHGVIIDDCYNANPVSVKAALDLLQTADTRRVAVLGDMFELGENEISLHAETGRYAAPRTDLLVCIGRLSRHMFQAADESGQNKAVFYFFDKESFLEKANDLLKPGDTILVKASHGMAFETLVADFQTRALFLS